MKRKFVVVLVAQSILILMFLVFSLYQQTLAEASQIEAMANARLAKEHAAKVIELERALQDCK